MYHIIGYQTNPITGETQFQILCDTAADLPTSPVSDNGYGGEIGQGSKAVVIADGSSYTADSNRQWIYQPNPNAWVNVYTKPEIDSMVTEIYETIAFYHTTLVSDTGEITFYAFSGYIGTWAIFGNGSQTGTPTPDNPITPDFVGTLDGADWTIPITCAGQTVPVYLGQVQTVRRIKKLVLTGEESWGNVGGNAPYRITLTDIVLSTDRNSVLFLSSHYLAVSNSASWSQYSTCVSWAFAGNVNVKCLQFRDINQATLADFKAYLAQQYAAGTPVTVWYVLEEPETGIVNEPLAKIGDYADELHSTDAGVTIPTVRGSNTLTVDTILKPSHIEIQG